MKSEKTHGIVVGKALYSISFGAAVHSRSALTVPLFISFSFVYYFSLMCANRRNFLHYVCTGEKSFFLCLCCFRDSVLARFNKLHSSALCSFELCRFSLVAAENSFFVHSVDFCTLYFVVWQQLFYPKICTSCLAQCVFLGFSLRQL